MTERRYYIKDNPEKEPAFETDGATGIQTPYGKGDLSLPASSYTKPEATIMPRALLVVFSGGKKKERDYFHLVECGQLYQNIKIDFFANPNFKKGGEPEIVDFSINKMSTACPICFQRRCSVWRRRCWNMLILGWKNKYTG